jgi:hypothetical protein
MSALPKWRKPVKGHMAPNSPHQWAAFKIEEAAAAKYPYRLPGCTCCGNTDDLLQIRYGYICRVCRDVAMAEVERRKRGYTMNL